MSNVIPFPTRHAGQAEHSEHVVIDLAELQTALSQAESCPVCRGGLGICVEPDGDWDLVEVHATVCTYRTVTAS